MPSTSVGWQRRAGFRRADGAERRRRLLALGGATALAALAAFLLVPRVLHRTHEDAPPLALQVESGAHRRRAARSSRAGPTTSSRRCASATAP